MWPGSPTWRTLPGRCTGRRLAGEPSLISCCPQRTIEYQRHAQAFCCARAAEPNAATRHAQAPWVRGRAVPVRAGGGRLSFPRSARGRSPLFPSRLAVSCRVPHPGKLNQSVDADCESHQNLTGGVESIHQATGGHVFHLDLLHLFLYKFKSSFSFKPCLFEGGGLKHSRHVLQRHMFFWLPTRLLVTRRTSCIHSVHHI